MHSRNLSMISVKGFESPNSFRRSSFFATACMKAKLVLKTSLPSILQFQSLKTRRTTFLSNINVSIDGYRRPKTLKCSVGLLHFSFHIKLSRNEMTTKYQPIKDIKPHLVHFQLVVNKYRFSQLVRKSLKQEQLIVLFNYTYISSWKEGFYYFRD